MDFASASSTICIFFHEQPLESTGVQLQHTTDPCMHFWQLSYQLTNYHENWYELHDIGGCPHCCTVLFPRIHNNMAITLPCLLDTMVAILNLWSWNNAWLQTFTTYTLLELTTFLGGPIYKHCRNFSLPSSLKPITNEPTALGKWNLMQSQIMYKILSTSNWCNSFLGWHQQR